MANGQQFIGQLFTTDIWSLIFSVFFALLFIVIAKRKNYHIPNTLILMNFLLLMSFYVSFGLAGSIFGMIEIVGVGFIAVYFFNNTILTKTYSGETKILLNYTVFIGIVLTVFNFGGFAALTGALPPNSTPVACSWTGVLDVIGNNYSAITNPLGCIATYISLFFSELGYYFNFSTTIGLLNTFMFIPFTVFVVLFAIHHIPLLNGGH